MDINVYVGDITPNDGVPSFVRPSFDEQAFVAEVHSHWSHITFSTQKSYSLIQFLFVGYEQEAPVGSVVFQAQAIDPDDPTTPNGRLTYKFLDEGTLGSDHAFFEIRE